MYSNVKYIKCLKKNCDGRLVNIMYSMIRNVVNSHIQILLVEINMNIAKKIT